MKSGCPDCCRAKARRASTVPPNSPRSSRLLTIHTSCLMESRRTIFERIEKGKRPGKALLTGYIGDNIAPGHALKKPRGAKFVSDIVLPLGLIRIRINSGLGRHRCPGGHYETALDSDDLFHS